MLARDALRYYGETGIVIFPRSTRSSIECGLRREPAHNF